MRSVIPVGLLLVALLVLATLQYQWIGQISLIERQKLESGLTNSSKRFASDFAAERERLYGALESRYRYSGDLTSLIAKHHEWAQTAPHPNLVKTLYVADANPDAAGLRLRQVDFDDETAAAVDWPGDLANLEKALEERQTDPPRGRFGGLRYRPNPGDAMVLVIEMMGSSPAPPTVQTPEPRTEARGERGGPRDPREPSNRRLAGWVIARLDRDVMTDEILPSLADRHFPRSDGQGYRLAVVDTDDNLNQVYTTSGPWSKADLESSDYAIDLFGYSTFSSPTRGGRGSSPNRGSDRGNRGDRGGDRGGGGPGRGPGRGNPGFGPGGPGGNPGGGPGGPGGSLGGSVPGGPGGPGGGSGGPGGPGGPSGGRQFEVPGGPQASAPLGHHWRLLVKNEAGSLEAAVEQARRRNLGVSFGVLLVLSAAALTLVFSGQRARALGKLQMEFAAGVSHELRTPLTVIQSAAHNLRSGVVRDPKNVEQYAEIVQKEARRLTGMVEQVMAYAETQSGRRRYDITAVDVTDIVEQALKTLAFVDDVEVKVERRIPSDLPPALADPVALAQCLQNLISNAVKYGQRDGAVELDIEASHETVAGRIRLSVMDRGRGVPIADIPHLFDAFHRGSNVNTATPGNGIGLHLVRKTIESQNGSVSYANRPGGGAVFTLTIPSAEERG